MRQGFIVRRGAGFAFLLFGLWGCGDATGPGEAPVPGAAGLTMVAGATVEDTIFSRTRITVEVRDARGFLAPGVAVRFEALPPTGQNAEVVLRRAAPLEWGPFAAAPSDSLGQVTVDVLLGFRAGPGTIRVTAPTLQHQIDVPVVIRPGRAVTLRVLPRDTALYAGKSVVLTGQLLDGYGNVRPEIPTLSTSSDNLTLNGNQVRAESFGRGEVTATSGGMTAVAGISVVPEGTIATAGPGFDQAGSIVILNLDGSGYRTLPLPFGTAIPNWHPDGGSLIASIAGRLFKVDMDGVLERLIHFDYGMSGEFAARYSPDGASIYYATEPDHTAGVLYRAASNGSFVEQIGPDIQDSAKDWHPAPSPDGTRLVYQSNREVDRAELLVLDLSTRIVTKLGLMGSGAAWSPVADSIAYLGIWEDGDEDTGREGRLFMAAADGTGERMVTPPDQRFEHWVDFSPDGRYLIGKAESLMIIEVATGKVASLPYEDLSRGTWRP